MTTEAVNYELFPLCAQGRHSECIAGYASVTTVDGQTLPASRCNCACKHADQAEREMRGDD